MLDGWVEDILDSLVEINKSKGREPLNPDDEIAVTNAVFSLVKSYAFRSEFPGVMLMISDSEIQYSRIYFPEYNDPYDDDLDIRDEAFIHPLHFKFQYPEYLDIDDPEPVVWERPQDPQYISYDTPIHLEKTELILDHLRQKSEYYAKLLENDPEKQIQNLKELDDIRYDSHENFRYHDIDMMTHMSQHSGGNINHVFGHRYVAPGDQRHYVTGTNWLGPVGVCALGEGPSKYVLSSISVSPSYRRQGISSNLLRHALKMAYQNEKYIERTSPSVMGDELTHEYYTKLAKKEFPKVPFVSHKDAQYIHAITKREEFHKLPFSSKCSILNDFVSKVEQMVDELESKSKHPFPYDHLDLQELQDYADNLWNQYKKAGHRPNEFGPSFDISG